MKSSMYYRIFGGVLGVLFLVAPAQASYVVGPQSSDFAVLSTAWNPGGGTRSSAGNPAPGSATWSIMPAGLGLASGIDFGEVAAHGSNLTIGFDTMLTAVGREAAIVGEAMDIWAAVSGFTNSGQAVDGGGAAGATGDPGGRGNIRVAGWEITTAGVLAHAYQPGTAAYFGTGGNIAGDVHMDVARTWTDNLTSGVDFFTVMLHELGHAIGLGHSGVVGSVMEPVYAGARRTLHADDIAGIRAIYGPELSSAVPEPTSLIVWSLIAGIGGFGAMRRRRIARDKAS